jgi:hypothetical protein
VDGELVEGFYPKNSIGWDLIRQRDWDRTSAGA